MERRRTVTNPEGMIIGRALNCDWPMPEDGLLSRSHFRLNPTETGCELTDLGSTNGTNRNDEALEPLCPVNLAGGDVIQAGRSLFRIHFEPANNYLIQAAEMETREAEPGKSAKHGSLSDITNAADQPVMRICPVCERRFADPGAAALTGYGGDSTTCPDCRQMGTMLPGEIDLAPHYQTVRVLGRGSMGVVYLARQRDTGAWVALKIIDPETATSRTAIDRFLREMAVIGTLKHPNIVECLEQGMDDGHLWFAMEFVSGMSLEALAQSHRGNYPVEQACRIMCQVLKGLEYAHEKGFVHRDIKPENILIGRTPENRLIAKISDFGLAKNYQSMGVSGLTFSGEMRGTIPFMPPEQMIDFKTVKPSADLYACAATLYYLVAGTYVFDSQDDSDDMIQLLLDHRIVPLADRRGDVPQALSDLVSKCLAKNPEDRLPTAAAMRNALKAFT